MSFYKQMTRSCMHMYNFHALVHFAWIFVTQRCEILWRCVVCVENLAKRVNFIPHIMCHLWCKWFTSLSSCSAFVMSKICLNLVGTYSTAWEMIIQGRIQEFLMGVGGVQTLVQKGLFCGKLLLSYTPQAHTPSHQSRLHVVIPWPLSVCCFGSRGEQIIRGYPKTITFFNLQGI